jgi:hypothetical protein
VPELDRPRGTVGEPNDQVDHPADAAPPFDGEALAEQRVMHAGDRHLRWERLAEIVQCVARSPGTGKTHLSIAFGVQAARRGYRVAFGTAWEWVRRLQAAHDAGRLAEELRRLLRTPLIVVDEVGYIPLEAEAANLFFQLVASRYERASMIVTSNKPFGRWGEVFGDPSVAAAIIDRLVHHAEVISLKGDSYRLKDRDVLRLGAPEETG